MGTVPTPPTAVTNNLETAAALNLLRDGVNWFLTGRPLAALRQGTIQSLTTAVTAAITMDTEDQDRDGGHSTVTNTSRYTAQTAGWYLVIAQVCFATNATGRREAALWKNGSGTVFGFSTGLASTGGHIQPVHGYVSLAVADYVEVAGFQNSGGALNTGTVSDPSRMAVFWMGS